MGTGRETCLVDQQSLERLAIPFRTETNKVTTAACSRTCLNSPAVRSPPSTKIMTPSAPDLVDRYQDFQESRHFHHYIKALLRLRRQAMDIEEVVTAPTIAPSNQSQFPLRVVDFVQK